VLESWKEAKILPVLKKGDRKRCENYGEVSLLNDSCKWFVKIIAAKLQGTAEVRVILLEKQS
jgi:hypothetical protein